VVKLPPSASAAGQFCTKRHQFRLIDRVPHGVLGRGEVTCGDLRFNPKGSVWCEFD